MVIKSRKSYSGHHENTKAHEEVGVLNIPMRKPIGLLHRQIVAKPSEVRKQCADLLFVGLSRG